MDDRDHSNALHAGDRPTSRIQATISAGRMTHLRRAGGSIDPHSKDALMEADGSALTHAQAEFTIEPLARGYAELVGYGPTGE